MCDCEELSGRRCSRSRWRQSCRSFRLDLARVLGPPPVAARSTLATWMAASRMRKVLVRAAADRPTPASRRIHAACRAAFANPHQGARPSGPRVVSLPSLTDGESVRKIAPTDGTFCGRHARPIRDRQPAFRRAVHKPASHRPPALESGELPRATSSGPCMTWPLRSGGSGPKRRARCVLAGKSVRGRDPRGRRLRLTGQRGGDRPAMGHAAAWGGTP
jgi:hypothetical protein